MGIETTDRTGELPTAAEAESAINVVKRATVVSLLKLPPELAIEMTNILRCLEVAHAVLKAREAKE